MHIWQDVNLIFALLMRAHKFCSLQFCDPSTVLLNSFLLETRNNCLQSPKTTLQGFHIQYSNYRFGRDLKKIIILISIFTIIFRKLGMNESLFSRLDSENNVVSLTLQYRMNSCIMDIANKLTYHDQLQVGNETIANATLPVTNISVSCSQICIH